MKKIQFILAGALIALMAHVSTSMAEDTDIYSGLAGAAGVPNIMMILDNAANSNAEMAACTYLDGTTPTGSNQGSKSLDNYMCALDNISNSLPTNANGSAKVNLGITTQAGVYLGLTPVNNAPYTGVYPHTAGDTNRQVLSKAIRALKIDPGLATQGTSFQETWAYYTGGNGGSTNVGIKSGTAYTGTNATTGCQKNFTIFASGVTNSAHANTDGDELPKLTEAIDNAIASGAITAAEGAGLKVKIGGSNEESPWAVEWARFMHGVDINTTTEGTGVQRITTFSIAAGNPVYPAAMGSMERYIRNTAVYGGGKYFAATSSSTIYQSLLRILNEVQAVNSAFSSSSLPVSVNAQGTFLNQIYMGMFRPDAIGAPRWLGNMKQYQFVATRNATTNDIELFLGDSLGDAAISSGGTGFLSPDAVSYWTCGGNPSVRACSPVADPTAGFWANDSKGVGATYDLPDGEYVEKGGSAQVLRLANLTADYTTTAGSTTNPRKLYTFCPSGSSCNALLSHPTNVFDPTNTAITDTLLKVGTVTISSITSAATVSSGVIVTPGIIGIPTTVTITALSKSGATVTANVSAADALILSAGTLLKIATGASRYDCDPCTVISVGASSFTYTKSGGGGAPALPHIATIYSSFATVAKTSHGLSVGQLVTIKECTIHTALNNIVASVTATTTNNFNIATTALATSGADTTCTYTPNMATATTATSHGFAAEEVITITGITPAGYNGTWTITPTSTNNFTYQYTVAAPLANSSTAGIATGDSVTRSGLIKWVRGEDNVGDEKSLCPPGTATGTANCPSSRVTVRPSIHGDVLHSRPVALNYGGAIGVVVYYGGNDGVYRAVNGNQVNPTGSSLPVPGGELWGFIPSDFFGKLKRLYTNSPLLALPSTPSGIVPTPQRKDYFADGSTSVYQKLNADGATDKAYIYFTMRRGGDFIYALDVSNPTNPQFLWKLDPTGITTPSGFSASTDFAELGQTWSDPKVALIKGYANPVMIFGAGYSTTQDAQPATADTVGRGVYIVDAINGNLVWRATYGASSACSGTTTKAACTVLGMDYSIPSDIALLDKDSDGYVDRLYVGDMGGNVWRVDLQPSGNTTENTPNFWRVRHTASLGGGGVPLRKFFFPPDVIPTNDFDLVIAISGDREHPLSSTSTRDRVFALKDVTGDNGSSLTYITNSALFDATTTLFSAATATTGLNVGYFKDFLAGEKGVNAPLTVAGFTYFGSNQPTGSNSCTANLGLAKGYRLDPFTGAINFVVFDGGGLPPSPVAGLVNLIVQGESTESSVPFCIGCGGSGGSVSDNIASDSNSALGGSKPPINVPTSRTRTYWYQEID